MIKIPTDFCLSAVLAMVRPALGGEVDRPLYRRLYNATAVAIGVETQPEFQGVVS